MCSTFLMERQRAQSVETISKEASVSVLTSCWKTFAACIVHQHIGHIFIYFFIFYYLLFLLRLLLLFPCSIAFLRRLYKSELAHFFYFIFFYLLFYNHIHFVKVVFSDQQMPQLPSLHYASTPT